MRCGGFNAQLLFVFFAVSSFFGPDPDPDQFCVSNFSICVYLLCVPMLLVRLRWLRFRARLRLVLLVRRRRVSSSSEIKSFNLSAIVWLVSLANNETLCADTASIWSSKRLLVSLYH
jgi:hypothetical protein